MDRLERKHSHLVCIDSDGCAIDGMTIKHLECFGPCVIEEWGLEEHHEPLLKYWNRINLYSLTRGINRFKGLVMMLNYAKAQGYLEADTILLEKWVQETGELSNPSLESAIECCLEDETLRKALSWSKKVNQSVAAIPEEKKPAFPSVKAVLEQIHKKADIAVVSAANAVAITDEWNYNQIMDCVDLCMGQEYGSKKDCLAKMLELGYEPSHVIMLGDALGDFAAAQENGILFYPIRAENEEESWQEFGEKVFDEFINDRYSKDEMMNYVRGFRENLGEK